MLYDKRWDVEPAPVKELEDWQKIVVKMIKVLEEHGWCQGRFSDGKGVCLQGALNVATKGIPAKGFTKLDMAIWLSIQEKSGISNLTDFNDTGGRTKEEVINMLRELVAK